MVKAIIVASPGFVKDQFLAYVNQTAVKTDNKALMEARAKIVPVHASSGFKHSLKEVKGYLFTRSHALLVSEGHTDGMKALFSLPCCFCKEKESVSTVRRFSDVVC